MYVCEQIEAPAEEARRAQGLADAWQALHVASKTKDLCLVKVKGQFREVTRQQVAKQQQHLTLTLNTAAVSAYSVMFVRHELTS
jgi:hypothetical protein